MPALLHYAIQKGDKMMDEFKPCPFCGSAFEIAMAGRLEAARCSNPECFMSRIGFQLIENLNTRPIEDALRAELVATKVERDAAVNELHLKINVYEDILRLKGVLK